MVDARLLSLDVGTAHRPLATALGLVAGVRLERYPHDAPAIRAGLRLFPGNRELVDRAAVEAANESLVVRRVRSVHV